MRIENDPKSPFRKTAVITHNRRKGGWEIAMSASFYLHVVDIGFLIQLVCLCVICLGQLEGR